MCESSGKAVGWCSTVIRHAAIHAKKRHQRTEREVPLMNHAIEDGNEWGDTIPSTSAEQTFVNWELEMSLKELPEIEHVVLRKLFLDGYTQERLATEMKTCQQQISRIKTRGLKMLRERFCG